MSQLSIFAILQTRLKMFIKGKLWVKYANWTYRLKMWRNVLPTVVFKICTKRKFIAARVTVNFSRQTPYRGRLFIYSGLSDDNETMLHNQAQ
jgi:hypothetical protein